MADTFALAVITFMKILPIILTLVVIQFAKGQSANQTDLVEILNVALRHNKVPNELINRSNPELAPWTNAPFIVIKSDTTKHLGTLMQPPDSTHVWIFDYEQIFLFDIAYGLVPVKITREQRHLTLDYKTVRYWTNKDSTCHSGQLIARKENDSWTIIKANTKKVKCEIDMFGQKK